MAKTVAVDNGVIDALLADPAASAAFEACLAGVRAAPRGKCGTCSQRRAGVAAAYSAAKKCLAHLSGEGRTKLKAMLGADQVKFYLDDPTGRVDSVVY